MEMRNALFTPRGMVSINFPTQAERVAFFKTKEYGQIRALIVGLPEPPLSDEVIEIRIPRSVNGEERQAADGNRRIEREKPPPLFSSERE